jgi:putative transposase
MVRYRRNHLPGGTFFFTVALANRQSSLLLDHIDVLRAALRETRRASPFTIDAIVILPEHLHAILTLPTGDADFPGRWRRIKSRFTIGALAARAVAARDARGEYNIWQKRYWEHTIRDDTDFARHADYIHFNPVKHGLVARPADWPHSSLHRYIRRFHLPPNWSAPES